MSALRRAGVWLGLVEDEDDRAYDDGYDRSTFREPAYRQSRYAEELAEDEDEPDQAPAVLRTRPPQRVRSAERLAFRGGDGSDEQSSSVRSITRTSGADDGTPSYHTRDNLALAPQVQLGERAVVADEEQRYQITTLHPTNYREARTIGEHFRDGVPVIINLTEMEEADARRLVDFAAGLAFGLRGTIERVTNRVFLLSPANVQVTAEDKAKIAEGGFFSLR
jgi:cell division inhibitor SepF